MEISTENYAGESNTSKVNYCFLMGNKIYTKYNTRHPYSHVLEQTYKPDKKSYFVFEENLIRLE